MCLAISYDSLAIARLACGRRASAKVFSLYRFSLQTPCDPHDDLAADLRGLRSV